MYTNEEHKKVVENRGYGYIGSYDRKEITIDGKNKKRNDSYIRVKCPYCGAEYDIRLSSFKRGNKCYKCCNKYKDSFAYYIQQELGEGLNKYWDWEKNKLNPYFISKGTDKKIWIKCDKTDYHGSYLTTCSNFYNDSRCPYCINHKIHPKDSFAQYCINNIDKSFLEKYWSDKNTIDPFVLSPNSKKRYGLNVKKKNTMKII